MQEVPSVFEVVGPVQVSFALYPSASAEDAEAFERVAERYAVDGRVEFFMDTSTT